MARNSIALTLSVDDRGTAVVSKFSASTIKKVEAMCSKSIGSVARLESRFVKNLGGAIQRVGSALTNLKTLALGALAGWGLTNLATGFIETGSKMDQMRLSLDTITKGEGAEWFERINEWALRMPVNTEQAIQSFIMMRAVGLQPVLLLIPALGLEAAWQRLEKYASPAVAGGLVVLTLLGSLGLTVRDYFFRYGTEPELRYAFETAATEMATQVNRFLGVGWQGEGLAVKPSAPHGERRVYLDEHLWNGWPSVQFLVPESPALQRLGSKSLSAVGVESVEQALLVLWPYEPYRHWLDLLPPNREMRVCEGPLERGDLEEMAYPLYLTVQAGPAKVQSVLARLEHGLELIDYRLETVDGQHLRLVLRWRATEPIATDYSAFVQLLQDGRLVVQDDAPPGTRFLPTSWWRLGDVVVDEHHLELSEPYQQSKPGQQMIAGLYESPGLDRLSVLDENGQPHGYYVPLN